MKRKLPDRILNKIEVWNEQSFDGGLELFDIEIEFQIGRAGNDAIAFDSVLSYACFLLVLGEDAFNVNFDHDEMIKLKLPLAKIQWSNDWFYNCGWIPGIPERVTRWTKRFEKHQLQAVNSRRVSVRQGQFKSYHMPLLYDDRRSYTVRGVGVIDTVALLLDYIGFIGKKSAIGFGQCCMKINRIDRSLVDNFRSYGIIHDCQLQRPLPVESVAEFYNNAKEIIGQRRTCPIHPPYFGQEASLVECWDVGTMIIYR